MFRAKIENTALDFLRRLESIARKEDEWNEQSLEAGWRESEENEKALKSIDDNYQEKVDELEHVQREIQKEDEEFLARNAKRINEAEKREREKTANKLKLKEQRVEVQRDANTKKIWDLYHEQVAQAEKRKTEDAIHELLEENERAQAPIDKYLKKYRKSFQNIKAANNEGLELSLIHEEIKASTKEASEAHENFKKGMLVSLSRKCHPILVLLMGVLAVALPLSYDINLWREQFFIIIVLSDISIMSLFLFLFRFAKGKTRQYVEEVKEGRARLAGLAEAGKLAIEKRLDREKLALLDRRDQLTLKEEEKAAKDLEDFKVKVDKVNERTHKKAEKLRTRLKELGELRAEGHRQSHKRSLENLKNGQAQDLDQAKGHLASSQRERQSEFDQAFAGDLAGLQGCIENLKKLHDYFESNSDPLCQSESFPRKIPLGKLSFNIEKRYHEGCARNEIHQLENLNLPYGFELSEIGWILVETGREGKARGVKFLQDLMLKLMLAIPAAKSRFVIFDPVDLGQNFAGFASLADLDENLIGPRIWTEAAQIDSRIHELTEQMEVVIQKYLRSHYATILDYNLEAGEVAEPLRFLVLMDFPQNISEQSLARLKSILSSGAKCGVRTLILTESIDKVGKKLLSHEVESCVLHLKVEGDDLLLPLHPESRARLDVDDIPGDFSDHVKRIGENHHSASTVELPFSTIAPQTDSTWSRSAASSLEIPIGKSGAQKVQDMKIGKGTEQHVVMCGKTGSGKSTLLHVLITSGSMWYSPEELEFYLVDFKKGVEFNAYAIQSLPHARAVAIESDREFGLSVLQKIDEELVRRGDLYRKHSAQDFAGYRECEGEKFPRTLLVIDEFQELFTEEDRVAQEATLLLDRIVRQGRAFGIHVILGTQTLAGAYTLSRSTLSQIAIRIVLPCNESDSYNILADDNHAARLLSRPGEAIYNHTAGTVDGNSPFQVVWQSASEHNAALKGIREKADADLESPQHPFVFEGNVLASIDNNDKVWEPKPDQRARFWLGEANAIKGPTEMIFEKHSGSHLLIVGQNLENAEALLVAAVLGLRASLGPDTAFDLIDGSRSNENAFERFHNDTFKHHYHRDIPSCLAKLQEELEARKADATTKPRFLLVHGLQSLKELRKSDDYSFGSDDDDEETSSDKLFETLLEEGPEFGVHVICWCDNLSNLQKSLSRQSLGEFARRVLFHMNSTDSSELMDRTEAANLGLYRALLFNTENESSETFRPYSLPSPDQKQEF